MQADQPGASALPVRIVDGDAPHTSTLAGLRALWHHRELLVTLARREIQIRYRQSLVGVGWAILQPLVVMVVLTIVFSKFARIDTGDLPYPVFSYCALLPWQLFSNGLGFGIPSIVLQMNLVTKIYFPREVLPIASIIAAFVDYCVATIFIGMLLWYHIGLSVWLLLVPCVLLVQLLFMVGLALVASAANVYYRDIRFVVPLLLQIWMYATPIIYPTSLVPERYRLLYMCNPMAGVIDSFRRVILEGLPPDPRYLGIAAGVALVMFVFGYRWFKRAEMTFADVI